MTVHVITGHVLVEIRALIVLNVSGYAGFEELIYAEHRVQVHAQNPELSGDDIDVVLPNHPLRPAGPVKYRVQCPTVPVPAFAVDAGSGQCCCDFFAYSGVETICCADSSSESIDAGVGIFGISVRKMRGLKSEFHVP